METKYSIIKHRAFWKTLTFFISTNNEDIVQKLLPDTYDHTLMLYKINGIKGQSSRSHQGYIVEQGAAIFH